MMEAHIFSSVFFIKCVININTLCTTFNAEPNRYIGLKKMMHPQAPADKSSLLH